MINMLQIIPFIVVFVGQSGLSCGSPEGQSEKADVDCSWLNSDPATETCEAYWGQKKPPVVLISMDGFRPEYLNRLHLKMKDQVAAPTLHCLASDGVQAPFMMPSFPTITFPNHYSIITGLYPESHSIIANKFYDPDLGATFSIRYPNATDAIWWRNGEPFWATAKKQGRISATYFWPGSDVIDEITSPNYSFKYNKSRPFGQRVDQILHWLELPADQRPDVLTLYFEEPDSTGHAVGPNKPNVTEQVSVVDGQIRRLIDGLGANNLTNCVNVIIVSDHGMAHSPPKKKLVDLREYVGNLNDIARVFYGPVTSIRPDNTSQGEVDRLAGALECRSKHMRVWRKWDLPYRMHHARSNRIPSLILDLDLGWRAIFRHDSSSAGSHGWDNLYREMHAIFMAHGPSFKKRITVRPFENVEIYNLLCALLNVTAAPNNGTWGALHHLLANPPPLESTASEEDEIEILRWPSFEESRQRLGDSVVNQTINDWAMDAALNVSEQSEAELLDFHAPLGVPRSSDSAHHGLLINQDYITAFDHKRGIPLWTQYTLTNEKVNSTYGSGNESAAGEWRLDPRLRPEHRGNMQRLNVTTNDVRTIHLFPAEMATRMDDVWLETNLLEVPNAMSKWIEAMTQLLVETQQKHGTINVITGPTRHDYRAVFYIVTTCWSQSHFNSSCPVEDQDLQAFLLPIHSRLNENCLNIRELISFHVSTLRDVERVTGFNFFSDMSTQDKVNLLSRTTLESNLVLDATRYQDQPMAM